jgi:hypothetical protein
MTAKPTVSSLILDATTGGRRLVTGGAPFLDVRNFGTVADGTTDDSTAIQAAIDAAIAQKIRLEMPAGQYKITTGLVINGPLEIYGAWSGSSGTGTSILCVGTTTGISITSSERVMIHGVRLTGSSGAVNGIVTQYAGATSFMHHFVRCRATGFTGAGFWQRNGEFVIWDSCFASSCGTGFLADQSSNNVGGDGINNEWRQCRAQSCTGDGFDIQDQLGFRLIGCEGIDNTAPNGHIRIRANTFSGIIEGAYTVLTSGGPATTGIALSGQRHIIRSHQATSLTTPISVLAGAYCEFHTCRYVTCTNGIEYSSTVDTYNLVYDPLVAINDPIPETSRNMRVPQGIIREVVVTTLGNNIQGSTPNASTTWPAINDAVCARCLTNRPLTITKLSWVTGTVSHGNYDIGILDSAGTVLWTKGSTPHPGTSVAVLDTVSPAITIPAGTVFWVVLATDSASATFRGVAYQNTAESVISDGTANFARVASSFPIPTSGTISLTTLSGRMAKIIIRTD